MRLTEAERRIVEVFAMAAIAIGVYGMSQSSNTLTLMCLAVALAWPNTKHRGWRLGGWALRGTFFCIVMYSLISEMMK